MILVGEIIHFSASSFFDFDVGKNFYFIQMLFSLNSEAPTTLQYYTGMQESLLWESWEYIILAEGGGGIIILILGKNLKQLHILKII